MYQDFHTRILELKSELQKFNSEIKTYFYFLEQLFERQVGFAEVMVETQILDLCNSLDNEDQVVIKTMASTKNQVPEMLYKQFADAVNLSRKILEPEIEMLRNKIMKPTVVVLANIEAIHKVEKKRQHKVLDVDRYKAALAKLSAKQHERSASEEKSYFVTQNNLEIAEQEYNWLNTLLKKELPLFFELTDKLIESLFISMYYVQLNIYYTLGKTLESSMANNTGIQNWNQGNNVIAAYNSKFNTVRTRAEKEIGLLKFRRCQSQTKLSADTETKSFVANYAAVVTDGNTIMSKDVPEYCIAIYDYEPQAVGDLRLIQGETVEIVDRTQSCNDWWSGKITSTGETGIFPANYVKLK